MAKKKTKKQEEVYEIITGEIQHSCTCGEMVTFPEMRNVLDVHLNEVITRYCPNCGLEWRLSIQIYQVED